MSYDFKKIKILVVECSKEMAVLLETVLNMLTVPEENIDTALDVPEALSKFAKTKHDLIITDWLESPDKGLKLTKAIRTNSQSPDPYVPIIMTAGSGHKLSIFKARDAGVSDYVIKPFSAKTLASRITRVIENKRSFVLAEKYIGPDRRFGMIKNYDGQERRKASEAFEVY